ncbi:MAG: biopolymer transporter ExbD [Sandaracinaceae bacterium]|jgi:biopolymer transport protein TolR|nr:biopolymer transporter ExbD [Sandaracinaceae bacterium]
MSGTLSPRQKAYVRKKTKIHDLDPSETSGELNIVPFLDIVVNIIMFLLTLSAYIVATSELDARLPTTSRGGRGGVQPQASLNLSVTIAENGIIVAGSGGKLAPGCTTMQQGRVITVPNLPSAQTDANADGLPDIYDWRGLTRCLATVKGQFPDESQVILSADPNVEYRHLIAAMDAVRADGELPLFPEMLLSAGVR